MKKIVMMILIVVCVTLQVPQTTHAADSKESLDAQITILKEKIATLQAELDTLEWKATLAKRQILADSELVVRSTDHTRGSLDAPIVLIEYTDLECPFCKTFHTTLNNVYKKYGASGDVLIVQRHFPLTQLHPNAEKIAVASECVAHLKGNKAYWEFVDSIFTKRKTDDPTDMKKVTGYAVNAGVNKAKFTKCLNKNTYQDVVDAHIEEGIVLGVRGTPTSFVVAENQIAEINGAQPFERVEEIIQVMLMSLDK
jgi:protein-disulfide isomerase